MGVDYEANQIYDVMINKVTREEKEWKSVCERIGKLYRYEFENILLVYAQRPDAMLVAPFPTWKRVGRYVRRGSKGIAIFPSKVLEPQIRHVFDWSDTGGIAQQLTWSLSGELLPAYAAWLTELYGMEPIANEQEQAAIETIKAFTMNRVRGILMDKNASFEESPHENDLFPDFTDRIRGLPEQMVLKSVVYAIGTRCGFPLSEAEQDFQGITDIIGEEQIYRLGSLVCDVSRVVLRQMAKELKAVGRQRISSKERGAYGDNRNQLQRAGGNLISQPDITTDRERGQNQKESGKIWAHGNGISERRTSGEIPDAVTDGAALSKDGGSRTGGSPEVSRVNGSISKTESTKREECIDGSVAASGTGKADGRGNDIAGDRLDIPLEDKQEVKRDLDEILDQAQEQELMALNSENEEGSDTQASLFAALELTNPVDEVPYEIYNKTQLQMNDRNIAGDEVSDSLMIGNQEQLESISPVRQSQNGTSVGEVQNGAEENWWMSPLLHFFREGQQSIAAKVLTYDIFTTNLDQKVKAEFLHELYGQEWEPIPMILKADNQSGQCRVIRADDGITILYRPKGEDLKEKVVDFSQCADILMHMIKQNAYLTEGIFEEYEKDHEAFEAAPPFMAVYHKYKSKLEIVPKEMSGLSSDTVIMKKHSRNFNLREIELPSGGPKTRFLWNIEAIQTLKQIEYEDRSATKEEQHILARYVGWGGLSQVFDERNVSFQKEYGQLKELLTKSEYEAARESVNTAFYTTPEITASIYTALKQFGLNRGSILEPSLGIGNFFGSIPEQLKNCRLYGVEKDDLSGRIAKLLYPKADIKIRGLEETFFPDDFFDAAVGNIPFGDYKIYDPKYHKQNFRIHEYFFAKALDKVRPGGVVAFITSKFLMDKANASVRRYLGERAELIGAIRLPDHVFLGSAGTKITSDILFLQKREKKAVIEPEWIHLEHTEDGIPVNSYFVDHPDMMLGHMEYENRGFGEQSQFTACVNREDHFNLKQALTEAVKKLSARIPEYTHSDEETVPAKDIIDADPNVKNYTYTFVKGKLYYRENSRMFRKEVPAKTEERILLMDQIRKLTRHLIFIQTEGCSEQELKQGQQRLIKAYESFVTKYGYLVSQGNARAFREDSDYPLLCSLEVVDEDGMVKKADMFYKQTINPRTVIERVETAVEALNVSIHEFGFVNLRYMLDLYSPELTKEPGNLQEERDYTQIEKSFQIIEAEQKRKALVKELSGLIYLAPQKYDPQDLYQGWTTADDYLSGNVRNKLRTAQAYAQKEPEIFGANVEALQQVQPIPLDASEIEVKIGTTWVEERDYEAFLYQLLNTPRGARALHKDLYSLGIQVVKNAYDGRYSILNKRLDNSSVAATKNYGTARKDAYAIFEESLNLRTATVRDRVEDAEGKIHYEINKNETMLAREKQNQMKQAFKEWLFQDVDRRQKYVEYYNETFHHTRLREYDGSHLTFPGMNPEIILESHQKDAIARILHGGNTLLAHCVGAGKSFEMMAACMEQRRLGLAHKTALVVPKALIRQTASEFLRLYPSANILVAAERDFEKSRRRRFISRIATGDYDCIILSHSQFERIPLSKERRERMLSEQVDGLGRAIEDMKFKNQEKWTIKQAEAQKKRLMEQLKRLEAEYKKDDIMDFEALGIDCVMIDEVHYFKNLSIFSKMNNVAGISSTGSQRAMDLYMKSQYLREINGNRGMIGATGTPISNSMCELYVMQMLFQKEKLEQMGISSFDAWAANFGEVTTALELTVEGNGFRFKSRFNKFVNLPELLTTFKEAADIKTADMLRLKAPAIQGGKPLIVESEPSWYVKLVMDEFVVRAEKIRNGKVDPSIDNFLKLTHEARLLGTDPRLLDPDAPNDPDGKLNKVAEKVAAKYVSSNKDGMIGCQLVFSDIGTPGKGFNVYDCVKEGLIARGIPAEEIAFIHEAKTDAQRETLFQEMRKGKKKILIGSTDKCGTGVNVQKHVVAIHHIDAPWKPSAIEQRDGRGLRQGNENEEVEVYRYVTKNTFDAYMWGILENKQRFISQIMTGRTVSRSCEDIDEAALSYAEIKAIATGNPLIREKMEVDNEVQRLKVLRASYNSQHYTLQDDYMVRFPKKIKAMEAKLACVKADRKFQEKRLLTEPEFSITILGVAYTERADGGSLLLESFSKCKYGEIRSIGSFKGFELLVEKKAIGVSELVLRGKTDYRAELSSSAVGNMVRLENLWENISGLEEDLKEKLEKYQRDMEQSKLEFEKPFAHEQELKELLARQYELNTQLDMGNNELSDRETGSQGLSGPDKDLVAEQSISYGADKRRVGTR